MTITHDQYRASAGPSAAILDTVAWTLVRVTIGLMLVPHGAQKLFGWFGGYGIAGTGQFFEEALGLAPGVLFALLAGLVEFFGGLALAAGLLTRLSALGVTILMAVAIVTAHLAAGFFAQNGGYEYPLLWGLVALAFVIRGGGDWSVDRKIGWKY